MSSGHSRYMHGRFYPVSVAYASILISLTTNSPGGTVVLFEKRCLKFFCLTHCVGMNGTPLVKGTKAADQGILKDEVKLTVSHLAALSVLIFVCAACHEDSDGTQYRFFLSLRLSRVLSEEIHRSSGRAECSP